MPSRLQLPQGASCFTFEEARRRRALESKVVEVFEGWGYDEIVPPLFDEASTFDASLRSKLYSFTGREGATLALRPDFTSLVAKIAAGRLSAVPAPLRLYYSGEVVRYEPPRAGRQSEFHQMGLEFLGGDGASAEVETLAIAIECLEAVGVSRFVVALGHAGVVTALLDDAGLTVDDGARDAALAALSRRDPSGLASVLASPNVAAGARDALLSLARDQGARRSIPLARVALAASPRALSALDDLAAVVVSLDAAGLAERVTLDLSESRGLDYYTGLVFRVYGADLGIELTLFVALMAALLTTIPFTPAGLGVVEAAVVVVLKLVDVDADMAGSIAVLDRVIGYWSLILVGLILYAIRMRRDLRPVVRG